MGFLSTAGAGAKTFFAGINLTALFYKLLIYIALGVALVTVAYREGKSDCEQTQLTAQVSILEKQIVTERETIVKQLEVRQTDLLKRLDVIGVNSRQAAQLGIELARIKGDLRSAIQARPANEACAPSMEELKLYDELAKRTRVTEVVPLRRR